MIWRGIAIAAMASMALSAIASFITWMATGVNGDENVERHARFAARAILVIALLMQSAVTMQYAIGGGP